MITPPVPENEAERLATLESLDILDTLPEETYDAITLLASQICDTPIALISLIDHGRQWFKSRIGLDARETPRDLAFCAHAIVEPESLLVVPDATADPRFSGNPLVTDDPSIRFYAGAPLISEQGHALGTLCVIDRQPRTLTDEQRASLDALATQVIALFELRWTVAAFQGANEELRRSNRDLAHFASVASHDLQTPVRNITNAISLLREDLAEGETETIPEYLDIIEGSGLGMQRLVASILEYANVNRGIEPATSGTDLEQIVFEILDTRKVEIVESGAEIVVGALPAAQIDEVQAFRLLDNIIGNAIKYRHQVRTPRITIEGTVRGASVVVEVSDNGIGFDDSDNESVFAMFRRLHPAEAIPGTGMGLAIASRVADQYGGSISASSRVGEGSTFTIELPAA